MVFFYMCVVKKIVVMVVCVFLKEIVQKFKGELFLIVVDYMDDGSVIKLFIDISELEGMVVFDFEGMGMEVFNCFNVFIVIIYLVILYCLWCLIGIDIFFNEGMLFRRRYVWKVRILIKFYIGCMEFVIVKVFEGIILNFFGSVVVCVGNGCILQCIIDVVLKVFCVCVVSYGCMNIFLFGNGGFDKIIG